MTEETPQDQQSQNKIPPKVQVRETPVLRKPANGAAEKEKAAADANPIVRHSKPDAPDADSGEGDPASRTAEITLPPAPEDTDEAAEPETVAPQTRSAEDRRKDVVGSSSQTIHIQLPDDADGPATAAPRAPASSAAPPTVKLKAPPTVKLKAPPTVRSKPFSTGIIEAKAKEEGVAPPAAPTDKRGTSRIPLPGISPPAGVPRPGSSPLKDGPKPLSEAQTEAAKRKTSRISLDAALSGGGEMTPAKSGAPKTIRLKRPVVSDPSAPASKTDTVAEGSTESGKTSKIPLDEAPTEAPSQRKTIRVKRPSVGGAAEAPTGDASDAASTAAATSSPARHPMGGAEAVNPLFPIFGLAAAAVLIAVIWVLAGHAVGPNRSLTPLSSWPTGPAITPPGLLSID